MLATEYIYCTVYLANTMGRNVAYIASLMIQNFGILMKICYIQDEDLDTYYNKRIMPSTWSKVNTRRLALFFLPQFSLDITFKGIFNTAA